MPYIIDGHNLIAAMPGINLADAQDERTLLDVLQPFARRVARDLYIYFDQGRLGKRNSFSAGRMHIRFSVPPRTADDDIHAHLRSIGKEGPNWVVVSSDREVLAQAERVGARHMTSEAFVNEITAESDETPSTLKPNTTLSEEQIDAWEKLFRERDDKI
ncbi:MAG: NYN domain-containing protein [Anaerolineales bacterium]|jgi:predicted RNA-binding protein with PIN domain